MTPSNEKAAGVGAVERKLFEKALRARDYRYFDGKLMGLPGEQVWEYMSAGTEHAWQGWQASRTDAESALKLQADRIAELERVLGGLVAMLPSDHEDRPSTERIPVSYCYVRWLEIREARAALAKTA